MGAAPRIAPVDDWEKWIGSTFDVRRFNVTVSVKAAEAQLGDREKWMRRLNLEKFDPKSEKAYEDWVDIAAGQVSRRRVSQQVFQEAWISIASPVYARELSLITEMESYEQLVDTFAKRLFPRSEYARTLENELYGGVRQPTVLAAKHWCCSTLTRYVAICLRHGRGIAISKERFLETFLTCLPRTVEYEVRRSEWEQDFGELLARAYHCEKELARRPDLQPTLAMPAEESTDLLMTAPTQQTYRATKRRDMRQIIDTRICWACGESGHVRNKCVFREHRCANCGQIGHIAKACRGWSTKDAKGRIKARVTPKKGGVLLETKEDSTQKGKAASAEQALQLFREIAERRSQRQKEHREKKREIEGWQRKRQIKEHPVQLAEEESGSGGETSDDDAMWGKMEEVLTSVPTHMAISERNDVVKAVIVVNGNRFTTIADTGAGKSLCSEKTAKELGLIPTGESRTFVGLGSAVGHVALPVMVQLVPTTKKTLVSFFVVKAPIHTCLGVDALKRLGVVVDPTSGKLFDRDEIIPVMMAGKPLEEVEKRSLVSVVEEAKTDLELIQDAENMMKGKCKHLEPWQWRGVWEQFLTHTPCWLRPRIGRYNGPPASFVVEGRPTRDRLRPLTPELRAELEKHIKEMLSSGVLVPSKSAWASVPTFVRKKNGTWRMALDYRRLNKRMERDGYPLPLIWDAIEKAAGHEWYASLDLKWGFWNIPLREESRQYTAVLTHKGLFEFTVLPFGIKNSPGEFQRSMDEIFDCLKPRGLFIYIDDIILFANTYAELSELLFDTLQLACERGIYLNLMKGQYFVPKLRMLGHIISRDGIRPCSEKVRALREAASPRDKCSVYLCECACVFVLRSVGLFIRSGVRDVVDR